MPNYNSKSILLFSLLVSLVVGLGAVMVVTGLWDILTSRDRLVAYIGEHRTHASLIFIALQIAQVIAAPLPGEITGFAGGILFGPFWGVLYSTVGLSIGSWLAFTLARLLGRPLVEKLVSNDVMKRYDYVMGHRGLLLAFLLFLLPGFPKDYLCYLLGLGHMRLWHFLAISITGRLFGTVLLTFAGAYFEAGRYEALSVVAGIGLILALVIMVYRKRLDDWLRRLHITHRHEQEQKQKRDDRRP